MFDRCTSTVFVDRYSIEAMALLVRPAAALSATCRSASVSTAPSDHGVNSASSRCARAAHSELPSSSNVVAASLSDAVAASAALAVKPDGTSLYVADGKSSLCREKDAVDNFVVRADDGRGGTTSIPVTVPVNSLP